MIDTERLREECRVPLAAGNVVFPVRRCVELCKGASLLDQSILLLVALEPILSNGADLWPAERAAIKQEVLRLEPKSAVLRERAQDLLKRLGKLRGGVPEPAVGWANALLTSTTPVWGWHFGACSPLEITLGPRVGEIRLTYAERGQLLEQAFWAGAVAAQKLLARNGLGNLHGAQYLAALSYLGTFTRLKVPVDGTSLGLAAAMGVLSRLLEVPLAASDAFTGEVDVEMRLHRVDGIEQKLEAAWDKGVRRVFLPAKNSDDVPLEFRSIAHPRESLEDVAREIFPKGALERAVARMQRESIPDQFRDRHWLTYAEEGPDTPKWLFSCVGSSDPFGTPRGSGEEGKPMESEEGPVLGACRELRPERVFLFFTQARGNDYTKPAEALERMLRGSGYQVEGHRLKGVTDPTDYAQVVPAMAGAVKAALEKSNPSGAAIYVNLTPGTPQMETTWHLLIEHRLLPGARRIQVRESRRLHEGEARVRLANPPEVR